MNAKGEKVGMVSVHLYRPFSVKHLLAAVPKTCKKIAVLDLSLIHISATWSIVKVRSFTHRVFKIQKN